MRKAYMKKVHLVVAGEYEDFHVVAAFTNKKAADACVNRFNKGVKSPCDRAMTYPQEVFYSSIDPGLEHVWDSLELYGR